MRAGADWVGGAWEGGAWEGVGKRNPVPRTCDRWSAQLSAMSADASEPESGPGSERGSEPDQLCPEHGEPLSWFCLFERRPVCAACARLGGPCHGHRIRRAEEHAEELRVSGLGAGTGVTSLGVGERGLASLWLPFQN